MRQFANVSISPWANPYNGTPTKPGQSYYTAATSPPVHTGYSRIVLPPAPVFLHPGVEQVIGEDSDDDQAGMLGGQVHD